MPFAKSRSRPDRSQRKAKLHKRIVFTNYAVPTGALDSRAADELLRLFKEINQQGQTILMVTHSVKAASTANRVLFIKDGEVFHQLYRGNMSNEELYEKISATLTALTTGGEDNA
ncbi:hypothetical protein RUMGNA_00256 [Mediterraneibacter gnavus ATCC 29149]|uniref:ABC transporter ATP-binding protein n=1 Tax=Mediterraneibacter gnavus (strain ATCC 29149 / DSM 114966 / JCM 6515 / VPI C7-9) TaxID=411470 RepID=A7AY91_MEDG7|nr:hypothetical protein RUMGNA_00256 [Mediterraneibacter gnavus ATCC 29149]